MASIKFTLSEPELWNTLSLLWDALSIGKSSLKMDREEVRKILGDRLKTIFLSDDEAEN